MERSGWPATDRAWGGAAREAPLCLAWQGVSRALTDVLECHVRLAGDRPDMLELRLLDRGLPTAADRAAGAVELPRPGVTVRLSAGGQLLYLGEVERRVFEEDGRLAAVTLAACSSYHFLRQDVGDAVYRNASAAEVARCIALELGLEASTDVAADAVELPSVRRRGDPLRFLRDLARELDLALAVGAGRLHLRGGWSGVGRHHSLSPRNAVSAVSVEEGREGQRRATVVAVGLSPVRPLDTVALAGFGAGRDGRYRALRCRLHHGAPGWRTEMELLDERIFGRTT